MYATVWMFTKPYCWKKGVVKELRRQYPQANIAAVDYDPGVSLVNQLNRIRLMMATANKLLKEENVKR